jgi:DNA-binding MarR family transcriptional regulator
VHQPLHLAVLEQLLARDTDASRVNAQHLHLLGVIAASDQPLSLASAAEQIDRSPAHTSRLVKTLVEHGFIKREWNDSDARIPLLAPTRKGTALDKRVRSYVAAADPATKPLTEDTTYHEDQTQRRVP